jgi:hypothetical protein
MNAVSRPRVYLIFAAAWFFSTGVSLAGKGAKGGEFLRFGGGARAMGMGEAQVALTDDVLATHWNPAGLGALRAPEVALMHNRWIQDVTHQVALAAFPMKPIGTISVGLNRLAMDEFQGFDAAGTPTRGLESKATALALGWGRALTPGESRSLLGGISAKWFKETHADVDGGAGLAADAGLLWRPWGPPASPWLRRLSFGAALKNMGRGAAFDAAAAPLPRELVAGAGYSHFLSGDVASVGLDLHRVAGEPMFATAGGEYWYKGFIAVRAGLRTGQDAGQGFRAGAGFRVRSLQVDYAWTGFDEELGDAHRISFLFRFGRLGGSAHPALSDDYFQYYVAQGKKYMDNDVFDRAILYFNEALEIRPEDPEITKLLFECGRRMESK